MLQQKLQIPEKVKMIITQLNANGYEAYAVGGCVRDALLGREPKDWDITTSAKPDQIKEIFHRTIDTGIQHGTVTVMLDKEGFEVTTYRIDGKYEDSRHPESVEFTPDLLEDLKRRDFTINAMAYNEEEGIIDAFEGVRDLERGVIRCVGNPMERFAEDALRMLRAIRFSGQLGFTIEENTRNAIEEKADTIGKISAERIREEIDKLLVSPYPEKIKDAYETGITKVVLPELDIMFETNQDNPHHCYNVGDHCVRALQEMQKEAKTRQVGEKEYHALCWTALLHDIAKPETKKVDENGVGHFIMHPEIGAKRAEEVLKRLRFDNDTIEMVCHLIKWHDYHFNLKRNSMRRAIHKIGSQWMPYLFIMQKADRRAQSKYQQEGKLENIKNAELLYEEVKKTGECTSLKMLKINGRDLLEIGYEPGRTIGTVLNGLLEIVLENPELNQKDILLEIAKEQIMK